MKKEVEKLFSAKKLRQHLYKKKVELMQDQFEEIVDMMQDLNFDAVIRERGEQHYLDGWNLIINIKQGFDIVSRKFKCLESYHVKYMPETTKLVKFLQKVSELSGIDIFECMTIS